MDKYSARLKIKASKVRVFDFLSKVENLKYWNKDIKSIEPLSVRENEEGSRYLLTRDSKIFRNEDILIEELLPNDRFVYKGSGDVFSYRVIYNLSEDEDGTIINNDLEVFLSGPKKLIFKRYLGDIKDIYRESMGNLKRYLDLNI